MLLTGLPVTPATPAVASSPAAHVSFTTEPGDGTPGNDLSTQPKVHVEDSSNTAVSGASVTLTLNVVFPADQPTSPPALVCDDATVTTDSAGDATFAGCQVSRAGRYTLKATVSALTATSEPFDIAGFSQLTFTHAPSTTAHAGVAWADQPTVTMQNTDGTTVNGNNSDHIGLVLTTAGGSFSQLSCTDNPVQVTAGVAAFQGCKIDAAGSGYKIYAVDSDAAPDLLGAASHAISITAGDPSHLAFTQQPGGGPGGVAFSVQPVVAVADAGGNPVPGFVQDVTLAITSSSTGATLTCAANPVAAVDGVASFDGCKIDKAGSGYTLTASIASPALTVASSPFAITAGSAAGIAFGTPPDGAHGGVAFTQQPVVRLTDSGGNPVNGSVTLSLDASTNAENATLTCAATTMGTTNGQAEFSGCKIDKNGTYQLTATSGTHSVNTADLLVTEGSASQLTFHATPTTGTGGTAFGTQPSVNVLDAGGNAASGAVNLAIAAGSGAPGATLTCASNGPVSPSSSGVAAFTGCKIDKAGTGYRLTATLATDSTVAVTSDPFDVGVGSASKIAFTGQPGGGAGGDVWEHQPVVSIEDAGGNLVSDASATVSLALSSGQGAGMLACKDDAVPTQNGVARFSDCAIDVAGGGYTLEATSSVGSATSAAFDVAVGDPATLRFVTQPAGALAGSAFGTQPVVAVVDKGGNTTGSSATIALSLTSGTGTAAAVLSCSGEGADHGVAAFSGCAIDQAGGGYVLTATDAADHLRKESGTFSVLLPEPAPLEQAPTPLPLEQSFGGRVYGDNPTATTDKVNTASGALAFASTDLSVAGLGEPFVLERSYNSLDTSGGAFGRGWSSIFDLSVTVVPGQTETLRGADGQQLVWRMDPVTQRWVTPPGAHVQLTCNAKTCKLIRDDNVRVDLTLTANGRGQVSDYLAPDGQGLTFTWSSSSVKVTLADSKTPTITGALDSNGHVTSLSTPTRTVRYHYTGGLLDAVTDVTGHTWQYGYDGSGKLTTITDPLGATRLSAGYDGGGRVGTLQVEGDENRLSETLDYTTSPQTTTRHVQTAVRGSAPTPEDYVDRYVGNVLVAQSMPSGATMRYSYDANLHLVESQDALGWTSTYSYDGAGNLTSQTVPISSTSAATVRMAYDGQHRITSQTDADGNTTTYTYQGPWLSAIKPPAAGNVQWTRFDYDGAGHLTDTVGPTNKRLFSYDARGNMVKVLVQDLSGRTLNGSGTVFTYDEAGNRLTSKDPLGHKTTWEYDEAGHQTKTAPPLGSATTYDYDAAGDLHSTTGPDGHTTSWTWDEAAGTRTTQVGGATTLVQTYDPAGNLLSEKPGPASDPGTTYTYDESGRQLTKTDSAGITTHYTYDLNSNIVAADDTSGQVLTQSFDALGKLVRRAVNGRVTSATYDPAGNVTSSTDAAGNATQFAYAPDSLVSSARTAAGTTSYGYDAAGNLVTVVDPAGHTTAYAYDALARKTKASEGGGSTVYSYDAANNLKTVTDPDGRKTAYTLDALNRVTSTVYTQSGQPTITVEQTYDALGRRATMKDPQTHTYSYDSKGNLRKVVTGADTFTYNWDTPGKISETYPDGATVAYSLDDRQKLMSVTTGTKGSDDYASASYLRNAQRQTVGIALANGLLETRLLNPSGDVLRQTLTLGGQPAAEDSFTYDSAGNPLSQVNSVNGSVTTNRYGYDDNGRLTAQTQSTDATGGTAWPSAPNLDSSNDSTSTTTSTTFAPQVDTTAPTPPAGAPPAPNVSYDGNGNRLSITTGAGTTTSVVNGSDQVSSQGGADSASYSYDNSGDMVRSVKGGLTTTYAYDAARRLKTVTPPSGGAITYTYDGDGNRTSRTQGGTTTSYLWDPANDQPQLALERDSAGHTLRRYLYGEGPVAMQVPDGSATATYFYSLDPQGNVTELTKADGSLAAAYHYDGFGNVTVDGDGHGNPLLFQSEYLDPGSSLYYMKARNYDATTGRFTQRDPKDPAIGAAVMTPYAFASDRPTALGDPKGESPESDQVFWSHNSDEANIGNDTKLATATVGAVIKGGMKLSELLGSKAVTATSSIGSTVGTEARVVGAGARELGSAEGAIAGASKEAGAAGEALGGAAKAAKFAGTALAVAGIGLQAFVTVEDCMHDTAYVCAADVVGLAISIAVTVGCEFVSAGAATVACAIIGGALAVAIPMLITKFGPQAVAGIIQGYNIVAGAVEAAIPIVVDAINTAIDAAVTFAEDVGGAIVSGFNQGVAAVTSGFWDAVGTLRDAGYTAVQLAVTLANAFAEGVSAAVSTLVDFGYQVADIATALADALDQTASQAAQWLKDTFNYTVQEVSEALVGAYDLVADGLAQALEAASYAVAEVVEGLQDAIDALAAGGQAVYQEIISILADVDHAVVYGINAIAGALQDVYTAVDTELTSAFRAVSAALSYTVDEVAGVLKTIYNEAADAAIAVFKAAGYLVDEAAQALDEVFHAAAALAADILDTVEYALNDIAAQLDEVWGQVDTQVAQIFQDLGHTAEDVVNALSTAFLDAADDVAKALQQAGYLAQEAMTAVSGFFGTAADVITGYFQQAGYVLSDIADALHAVFTSETAAEIITILEGVFTGQVYVIATSIAHAFSLGAAAVAQAFSDAGAAIEQITSIMKDAFNVASDAIAGILHDITEIGSEVLRFAASEVAAVLESIYQLADDVIAGLLQLADYAVEAINAIGDAFESFGQSVADGFSDAWDTVSSWF